MTEPEPLSDDLDAAATLEAIDATLAGQAVDPRHAEVAELALLLRSERPTIDEAFATLLDEGVQRRFAAARQARSRRAAWWIWTPSAAVAASLAVAVVIVLGQGGSGTNRAALPGGLAPAASSGAAGASSSAAKVKAAVPRPERHPADRGTPGLLQLYAPRTPRESVGGTNAVSATAQSSHRQSLSVNGAGQLLTPFTADRKVIQGAQLSLSTTSKHVDQVAQEVFNVMGQEKGIVKTSRVTANGGHGGYAQFQLSVPSANLPQTMAALSNLPYARVASRTDSTQDVTNQFRVDQRRLSDDRALRTALLKQLAVAVTQADIDSLNTRIHDAEGSISADETAIKRLNRSVGYSQVSVTINAGAAPPPVHRSTGFTVGEAAHDAGHVLTVAAGVALIGLAALLPLGLVAALGWWIYAALRRRSRLQALDQI
jgi:hypothetical protein